MFPYLNRWRFPLLASLSVGIAFTASGVTNYVATTGNDTNAGTLASPWRTIQKAANTLAPGDTVLVRGGVYSEAVRVNVSGSAAGGPVAFQNYPGEMPIVDGSTVPVPEGNGALFWIVGRSYVSVSGFEIRNYRTNALHIVPAGVWIGGAAHDIMILSNNIHHIENTHANADGAYGLVVYGDTAATISNIVIRANELHDLKTAWSESMALVGNVSDFEVSNNRVHDNWNIGILFAGGYGTTSVVSLDRARRGVCRDNVVWRCSTASNPNYNSPSCAGIYCDGSTDIIVERNKCFLNDLGMEFAAENSGKATDHITVRNNLCWSNGMGGIFIGGYDNKRGRTEFCAITHNTLYHNDTLGWGQGEMLFQFDTRSNIFTHNILVVADTANNLLVANTFTQNTNNIIDWNLYHAPGGAAASKWQWKKTARTGFTTYKTASGNDSNSIFADPRFVNAGQANFHLATNSPALNAGDPAFAPASGETDVDGQSRVAGGRTDIGADELNVFSPKLGIAPPAGNQLRLQLDGEPGHAVVWEQSDTLTSWLPFLTNSNATGLLEITNPVTVAMRFFRARMAE